MDHKITTQEAGSDVVTEIERVIVRRESRQDGKELFIFADGGVNIIPVDSAGAPPPVVYRSQGMQIEKWVGAVDTSLVVEGRHFDDCLEVITRFRTLEGEGPKGTVSYSTSSHTLRTSDAAWIRSRRSVYRPRRRYAQLAWDSQNNLDDTAYKAGFNALGGLDVLPERHELE